MNYLDAPEVSKDADRITGLRLLERAAEETGFSSDVINHAYTLALYHAGVCLATTPAPLEAPKLRARHAAPAGTPPSPGGHRRLRERLLASPETACPASA